MKTKSDNMSNEHSFERLGSSNSLLDGFSELEVGHEKIVSYTRAYVKFRRPMALVESQMFTPDLDALSLLELSSQSARLFTSLVDAGLGSKLINHFAECESSGLEYTDLGTDDVLIERVFRGVSQGGGANQSEKGLDSQTLYKLKHGMRSFRRLLELDKSFVPNILNGVESGVCKLARVDLCIDLSENIMPYVAHGIQTGQYKAFGRHPFGYGWLAGERLEGPVGRNTKLFKDFKDKMLILDTVYFGDSRKCTESAVFYNKREERKSRADSSWAPKSRIEVRLYPRTKQVEEVAMSILKSYLDEKEGWRKRIPVFGEVLCRCVLFTKTQRPTNSAGSSDVAPWWQVLLRALMAGSENVELPIIEKPEKRKGRPLGSKDKKPRKAGSGRKKNHR